MKELFFKSTLLVLGMSLLALGCNKEDENKSVSGNAKVDSYLKSFYHKKVQLGKTLESKMIKPSSSLTAKSVEYEEIKLAEVFVGDEERARGYVITDKETDEFLYFADVDRRDYKLTTFDVEKNEIYIKENIDQLQEWAQSNNLDFIKLLEEYKDQVNSGNVTPQEIYSRRFWGWTGWRNVGGCDEGFQTVVNTHYSFWIKDVVKYNEIPCNN